jgi:hypothetical protein
METATFGLFRGIFDFSALGWFADVGVSHHPEVLRRHRTPNLKRVGCRRIRFVFAMAESSSRVH